MGSKKEKQNPPPPKPEEESSEEEEEEEVEEDVEEEEEEEEEEVEEEEVEEKQPTHQKKPQPSSSSGTESASDEDDDDHSTSHPVKRQATPPPPETVPNSDDDETESDDDNEEEEEADPASDSLPSATASAYTVKPIATVPVNSKVVSKPTQKRALESSKNDGKGGSTDRKKAKTGAENDKKGKVGVFPARVWSEESEIVILQGILDYQRDKGPFRNADTGVFYEFIKGKLWDGVTKTQIGDKIKRLKTKYSKNVEKGKNGQDFPKAHDKKAYELSKQIWGVGSSVSNGKEEKAKTKVVDNGKGGKKVSNAGGSETKRVVEDSSKVKVKSEDPKGKKVSNDGSDLMDVDADVNEGGAKHNLVNKDELKKGDGEGDFLSKFPTLSKSFDVETVCLKDYLHLIGSQNASELEEEWKQLQLEEMNVAAKRLILKGKQAKLVVDAMKKQ